VARSGHGQSALFWRRVQVGPERSGENNPREPEDNGHNTEPDKERSDGDGLSKGTKYQG